ncbi:ribosome small subunit-dependent GTPase A [Dehalogenimonas formicexedens]|nr:ribosome small subunit-dependent GTPase A [Dehalogenimonas formicexedens]
MNYSFDSWLKQLGWNTYFQANYETMQTTGTIPARVSSESKGLYQLLTPQGEMSARLTGKMRYEQAPATIFPAVGDWVMAMPIAGEDKAMIHAVLPRKSKFSRKVAGECAAEQVVAANVDFVFIVSGLDGGRSFNLRRIERYLTLAWNSGAVPVVILNKADMVESVETFIQEVEGIAPGVSVHPVSARTGAGLEALLAYLTEGSTIGFLGSSGVGKSALINALLGKNKQAVGDVRLDDRMGRHTTTRRELIPLPGGGIVIDTPGMREIQMWGADSDLDGVFSDISQIAEDCRFKDCSHTSETGCAVLAAVERGDLDPARLENYRKLQKELEYVGAREADSARQYEKMKFKPIAKLVKQLYKER